MKINMRPPKSAFLSHHTLHQQAVEQLQAQCIDFMLSLFQCQVATLCFILFGAVNKVHIPYTILFRVVL